MGPSPKILLVEDDEDDRFLAERALKKKGLSIAFHAPDGRLAVEYLSGEGRFSDRSKYPIPEVILLDLKLPEICGHQVLQWARSQPQLASCKIFVLSSSGEKRDKDRAAGLAEGILLNH